MPRLEDSDNFSYPMPNPGDMLILSHMGKNYCEHWKEDWGTTFIATGKTGGGAAGVYCEVVTCHGTTMNVRPEHLSKVREPQSTSECSSTRAY